MRVLLNWLLVIPLAVGCADEKPNVDWDMSDSSGGTTATDPFGNNDADDGFTGDDGDGSGDDGDGSGDDGDGSSEDTDSDGDGLSDGEEAELGSDPWEADSDGDGWDDGVESSAHTDPTDPSDHPYTGGWPIDACRHDLVPTGMSEGDVIHDLTLLDQYGEELRLHDFCDHTILIEHAGFS